MAEAITRGLGGERVEARSAGLAPLGRIAEPTIMTVRRLGYEPSGLRSKGLDEVETRDLDLVVSLIGSSLAGIVPSGAGGRQVSWPIPDPYGEEPTVYLRVGRLLEQRIRSLLESELRTELSLR